VVLAQPPEKPAYRPTEPPPAYQPEKAPPLPQAPPPKPPAYVRPESVASISEVTDVGVKDEFYRDLQSLIERYGMSGLTKDRKFNGAANVSRDDMDLWTANGQIVMMSVANRQGIDPKKYGPLLGKKCGAPYLASYTEAQAMNVIQCRFKVPALKTPSPERIATRGRFAMMLNQAMDMWAGGLAKAIADNDAADAARIASKMSFFDTFENGQKGWLVTENPGAKTSIADGRFLMTVKFDAILISTIPHAKAPKLDPNRDFSIEVSFAFLNGESKESFGLVWGVSGDRKRRYSCGVSQDGSYYTGKHAGGIWKKEIKTGETNLVRKGPDQTNCMIVRKRGNQLDLYLNTILVTTVPYEAFEQNGSFGFQVCGEGSVAVDYIHVQQ
jgi:hypothetical protein